ncbi:MAG: anhydro-N-acetylmuramic acid kinase [Planctomycetes bacterium]|nr:anhydro-N-acetylmuramic acid kinase [Planctomycetota bacterium]
MELSPHPLDTLRARLADGSAGVAGVLSGTSADGIDVALVRFEPASAARPLGTPRLVAFRTSAYPPALRAAVRSVLDGGTLGLRESALLSRDLGRAFGRAARDLAAQQRFALDLVGSHGQTVWHHDGRESSGAATAQLGDGDFVAEEAGCTVASDFRQRDIAAGGEGAPVSALADELVFADLPRPAAILNLGGMANLTLLSDDAREDARAFDTGPANALLDGLARRLLGAPYDEGGAAAMAGTAHAGLLAELAAHEFLRRAPPKSTGRDTFGEAWVDGIVARARELGLARKEDLLATAAEFVAASVAHALREFGPRSQWLVVCGGGVHHQRVMNALALRCPQPVASGADFGVDPDAREALVFATLAARCALALPVTRTSATGARPGRTLGKLSWSAHPPR